jgi:tetratricopeptide (TPR) repeat protein
VSAAAIPELKRHLVLAPDDASARVRLGEALLAEGDAEGAVRQLERALQADPEAEGLWLALARALEAAGRPGRAASALREHLRRHPDDAQVHGSLAELLQIGAFYDEALRHAEQAAALLFGQKDAVPAILRAIDLCRAKGLEERALLHLSRALRASPGEPRLLAALRALYIDLGDEESLARVGGPRPRRAILHRAQREAAQPLLGQAEGLVGQAARALLAGDVGALRKVLRAEPPRAPEAEALFFYLRAELLLIDGQQEDAGRLLRKVLRATEAEDAGRLAALQPAVLARLGEVALCAADLPEAAACYRRALRLRPQHAGLYEGLGDVLALLGERAEATHTYEAALRLSRPEEAEVIGRRLAQLAVEPDADEPLALQLRRRQRGPEVGRIFVLGVCLRPLGPDEPAGAGAIPGAGAVPLFGVLNELQAVTYPGRGEVICTGLVGPELVDEARTAAAFVKAQAGRLGLSSALQQKDVHLHFVRPRNEGRSGGLGQVLALVSACTGRPLRPGLSASGSVTPLGEVHRVDGVREKLLAAYHAGLHTVMLPRACLRQVREAPAEILDHLEVVYVESALDACDKALLPPPSGSRPPSASHPMDRGQP